MNIIQFQRGYYQTLVKYGDGCYPMLAAYCQSVFNECKETMCDEELAQMIDEYYNCLRCDGRDGLHLVLKEVMRHREQVYRRLADKSVSRYGVQWADAWFNWAYENSAPLKEFDAIFALFWYLKVVCGCAVNDPMTIYVSQIASDCYQKGLHRQAIRYASEALKLYYEDLQNDIDVYDSMGAMYDLIGQSYQALGQDERAEENLAQAQKMNAKAKEMEDYYDSLWKRNDSPSASS